MMGQNKNLRKFIVNVFKNKREIIFTIKEMELLISLGEISTSRSYFQQIYAQCKIYVYMQVNNRTEMILTCN